MTGVQYLLTAIKNIIEKDIYLSTACSRATTTTRCEV